MKKIILYLGISFSILASFKHVEPIKIRADFKENKSNSILWTEGFIVIEDNSIYCYPQVVSIKRKTFHIDFLEIETIESIRKTKGVLITTKDNKSYKIIGYKKKLNLKAEIESKM